MTSKPGLGKGLGELMNGASVAGNGPRSATGVQSPRFGRGFNTLVNSPAEPAKESEKARKFPLPAWFFFAADILLLGFVVAVCFDTAHPLDFGTILFCAICVTFGAILAIAGVLKASAE